MLKLGYFGILVLFSASVAAAEPLEIVTEIFPPYQTINHQTQEVTGIASEIVKTSFELANLDYAIKVLPWARAYHTALYTKNTFIYSLLKTPARADKFHWLIPLCALKVKVYKHASRHDIQIGTLEDLKKYRLGIARDNATHDYLLAKGFSLNKNLILVNKAEQLQKMLASQRIDLFIFATPFVNTLKQLKPHAAQELTSIMTLTDLTRNLYLAANIHTQAKLLAQIKDSYHKNKEKINRQCDINQELPD